MSNKNNEQQNTERLPKRRHRALVELLGFIIRGDYSVEAKRHAKGLLLTIINYD